MAKCPECSTEGAYIGFQKVECTNSTCSQYKPVVSLPEASEHAIDKGDTAVLPPLIGLSTICLEEKTTPQIPIQLTPAEIEKIVRDNPEVFRDEEPCLPDVDWGFVPSNPSSPIRDVVQAYDLELYPMLAIFENGRLVDAVPSSRERFYETQSA